MDFDTLNALATPSEKLIGSSNSKGTFSERFEVIQSLGNGAFGLASVVRKRSDKRKCVSKELILFGEGGRFSKSRCDAAVNEVEVLSKLDHAHIVRYLEAIQQPDRIYLILEYCGGGDLSKLLRVHNRSGVWVPINEADLVRWSTELLMALSYLHERGMLHRDVKPANIFLTSRRESHASVKLGDFGLSKILEHVDDEAATRCGTPMYFSPELCSGRPYTSKNDIWALGCVVFEMMTGIHPFNGRSRLEVFRKVGEGLKDDPNPLGLYSGKLAEMVRLMLTLDPQERPSAQELLDGGLLSAQ